MSWLTITPAYGRDYKSAKAAKADFAEGKDFIVADMSNPYDGKPCNLPDLERSDVTNVKIRFDRMTKVAVVKI